MRSRRLAATILSLGLLFAAPPLASADDGDDGIGITPFSAGQCASGRFCIWSGTGYSGAFWSTGSTGTQSPSVTVARTIWNRGGVSIRLYSGAGATGSWVCVNAGALTTSTSVSSVSIRTMTTASC